MHHDTKIYLPLNETSAENQAAEEVYKSVLALTEQEFMKVFAEGHPGDEGQ